MSCAWFFPQACVSAKPPLTISSSTIRPRTRMFRSQQLNHINSHKDRPRKSPNYNQYPCPIRDRAMCNDQPAMSANARRYNAAPIGVRVRVQQRRSDERGRRISERDLNGRVVRAAKCRGRTAIGDGFEVALRRHCRRCLRG